MVRRGTVFSHAAFRYVDVVFGAAAAASLLTFALGVTLAPGEAVAPGVVLLIGGAGVLVAGVALVVLVLRMLLAQAVARRRRGAAPAGRAGRGDLMPIVVDIDVMLARRKMSVGALAEQRRDHARQPGGAQERSRQGGALHDARRTLRGARVPARRPAALGARVRRCGESTSGRRPSDELELAVGGGVGLVAGVVGQGVVAGTVAGGLSWCRCRRRGTSGGRGGRGTSRVGRRNPPRCSRRSRWARAIRWGSVWKRRFRPRSRTWESPPRTAGIIPARQASRRASPGERRPPVSSDAAFEATDEGFEGHGDHHGRAHPAGLAHRRCGPQSRCTRRTPTPSR